MPVWDPYALSSSCLSSAMKISHFIVVPLKFASHNVKVVLKNLFNKSDCLVLDDCNSVDGNFLCDSCGNAHNLNAVIKVWISQ